MIEIIVPSKTDIPKNGVITPQDEIYIINFCHLYPIVTIAYMYNIPVNAVRKLVNREMELEIERYRHYIDFYADTH